ncbi:MAG: 1-acyl-sn-glycerol-3-phosphate acyltransferase, partial [Pseudomonadota bacterium]|nr:1-acyl-sn-glycerol-3-phosphate acyltransferase [Pseudomonadota bacterium]
LKTILDSNNVKDAVLNETRLTQETPAKIEKKALQYAQEIASDQSYRVIRFFEVLLSWLWHKIYEGIELYNIDRAKAAALTSEVIYVPCHRSHIDYLLLSYVLYRNGLTPPHIAAGVNLNLPLVGSLLRRAGAFFMRRSFKGNLLYKAVFDEYLHLMLSRGHSIEYFIEGGRSRTGRMLNPRTGMISMTLNGYYRDNSKELHFLPVYFSYEKVMEISSYLGELAGRGKNKETLFGLLSTLKLLKKDFGRVAVSFGEPLNLRSYLDENLPRWHPTPPYDLHRNACINLANELSHRINDAAVLNTVNITAFAILCTQKNAIEIGRLEKQIAFLLRISTSQLKTTLLSQSPADVIENAIRITGLVQSVSTAGTTVQTDPTNQIALQYYYNNIIHLFCLPSLTALILRHHND